MGCADLLLRGLVHPISVLEYNTKTEVDESSIIFPYDFNVPMRTSSLRRKPLQSHWVHGLLDKTMQPFPQALSFEARTRT